MEEEDYEVLRNEANAEPRRYSQWDTHAQFRTEYEGRANPSTQDSASRNQRISRGPSGHETEAPLSRQSSSSSSSSSSNSSDQDRPPELQEIRTQRDTAGTNRRGTITSTTGTLYRHPTERHPEAIRRIETHRSQHANTVGAAISKRTTTKSARPIPEMGAGKPYPPLLPDREEYVVEYNGVDDPLHAQNWPMKKKIYLGAILAFDALTATVGSSIFSSAIPAVSQHFRVDRELGTLGTSLFVFGYAFGPLCWGPMSELYGRKMPIVISAFGFSVFAIATAVGKDVQTVLISRFFGGIFGSCPLVLVAAVFADMFNNKLRGLAVAVFSATVSVGPLLAPVAGGFITESYLGWRWTEYISAIMGWTSFVLLVLFMEETYPPVVLVEKASELRRRTKNWGIHAKQEEIEVDFKELVSKNVSRPFRILFTEPIVLLLTLYMSFVYALLYLFLTAYSLVFHGVYGWNAGQSGLALFGIVVGEMIAFTVICLGNPSYVRKLEANNNIPVPEWRMPIAIVGGVLYSGGLFWFGWTGYTGRVLWVAPVLSGLFTGFGFFAIFLSLLNYLVDAYLMFAASALAANTFMRSIFAGVFPLFATYMFDGMGIEWASTLLGLVAFILIPLPVILYFFGKRIRAKSKFAPAPDIQQDKERDEEARLQYSGNTSQTQENLEGSEGGDSPTQDKEREKKEE